MLISSPIPNMINGVSQQPEALRLASQAEEQINGLSSVVNGLSKRPPLNHLAQILPEGGVNPFIHLINRDATEQYVVLILNGQIRVFDLEGNEFTVNSPDGLSYLNGATNNSDLRAVTVADFTFIANKTRTCTMATTRSPSLIHEALVHVKQGNYGTRYRVHINDSIVATYTSPLGDEPSHINKIRTDDIAADLATQINDAGFVTSRRGSTIRVRANSAGTQNFSIRTEDGLGDTGMDAVKGSVQRFSDLPVNGFPGFKVEVIGDNTSSFDNYYLEYDDASSVEGQGVWKETTKPNSLIRFNPATMPHVLVREADGTFTFRQSEWEDRKTGDEDSNPEPTFIGRKINDIFFHRNRLGFISDENVVFSRAADFFNFWKATATSLLDNDPIDVAASHVKVSILRHAVPFNEELLLFSDQSQFVLGADDILTPSSAVIKQTTEFEATLKARPVGAGKFIYFGFNRGRFSGVREYSVQPDQTGFDAEDITANVPQYIAAGITKLDVSSNEDTLVAITEDDPSRIFVYRYFYSKDEVLQSSWSKWEFGGGTKILECGFIEAKLVLVVERDDGIHLCSMPVEAGYKDADATYTTHLDLRVDSSTVITAFTSDPDGGVTTFTLPYDVPVDRRDAYAAVLKDGSVDGTGQTGGLILDIEWTGANTFTSRGDWTGVNLWYGFNYPFLYRFTPPMLREEAPGGGMLAVTDGRLQLRNMSIAYSATGYFEVQVQPFARNTYRYPFTGDVVGVSRLGEIDLQDGNFRFPIAARNTQVKIDLTNSTFQPCKFLSAEWEGFLTQRARRM